MTAATTTPKQKFLGQKSRWWASALIWPFSNNSWKKFIVFAGTWFVLQPLSGLFFPRAEKVLEQQELNSQIVQELAPGKKVYVRTDNFWGTAHYLLDRGGLLLLPINYYSLHSIGGSTTLSFLSIFTNICTVYLRTSEFGEDATMYRQALLHEIRHCSNENKKMHGLFSSNVTAEGDADYQSIRVLAREWQDPSLEEMALLWRAALMTDDKAHDVALYLDAAFNGAAPPAAEVIYQANQEASGTYHKIWESNITKAISLKSPEVCKLSPEFQRQCAYDLKKEKLSPLALRRAELYQEGWKALTRKK